MPGRMLPLAFLPGMLPPALLQGKKRNWELLFALRFLRLFAAKLVAAVLRTRRVRRTMRRRESADSHISHNSHISQPARLPACFRPAGLGSIRE